MLRWLLFFLALVLAALGSLTTIQSPDWLEWRLAVLAGEFGHWLAVGSLLVAALAWWRRRLAPGAAMMTILVCALATGLLLKPCLQASQLARPIPPQFAAAFGGYEPGRPPFSVGALFGREPATVPVETRTYADGLALDFYRPVRSGPRAAPCVIVVHGGGWDGGERTEIARFNRWLAGCGYAVAAVSYRLAPKFIWPAQRDDVLAAIAFLKSRAGELGIDPTRLVLFGRSAGGQIAEVVGYTANDPAICGVIGLYAPSDMNFAYAHARENDAIKSPSLMRQFLGGAPGAVRAAYDSASALPRVNPRTPPTLLLHGRLDALTWYRHSERLAASLAENRVPYVFILLPWATHAFEFNLHGPGGQLTTYAVEWFLAAVTK